MKTISEFVSRNSWIYVVLAFLVLLMMAFGLEKKSRARPSSTASPRGRASRLASSPHTAAPRRWVLLTPFLPCGPLYLVLGAALLAGSAAKGAEFTLAFGLGTVPLLWLAQHQFHRIRAKLTPLAMSRLRCGLAFVTALVLALRLHGTIPTEFYDGETKTQVEELPSCCH